MAKIAIDAGHGMKTSGKRCLKSLDPNQTREWVLNDRVADALAEYLKSAGHTVFRVDDTDGSSDVSLTNRVEKANEQNADAYISIHHNAGIKGGSGGGTVVYVAKKCSSKSIELQNAVYEYAIKRANLKGNRSDGTRSANYYVIRHTSMPAVLVECGFMDSKTDIKYILDKEWSKKMALGIAEGVCEVFGGTVKAEIGSSNTSNTSTNASGNVNQEVPFKVRVDIDDLNIRTGPGTVYAVTGHKTGRGSFTIVEVKSGKGSDSGWGRLKSGAGWISLDFTKRL